MIGVNEDAWVELVKDETPIEFMVLPHRAFMILSAIQLACVHPEVGEELKSTWRVIGLRIQLHVERLHPELMELMEAGWEREHDVLVKE